MRHLSPDDLDLIPAMTEVFAEGLGAGYLAAETLVELITSDRAAAAVFVALAGGEVAGAATTDLAAPGLIERVMAAVEAAGQRPPPLTGRRVGQLRSISVVRRHRRQGLGSALTARRLAHLREVGCTAVVSTSWLSGDPDNSQGVLRRQGLEPIVEIPRYWGSGSTAAVYLRIW